jgi:hypothetical protein
MVKAVRRPLAHLRNEAAIDPLSSSDDLSRGRSSPRLASRQTTPNANKDGSKR